MQGERKKASDCDAFCDEYILKRKDKIKSAEEYAFLLGYYSHLITDAAFQVMIRDEDRVREVWMRIKADEELSAAGTGMDETWDSVKRLIPKKDRISEIYAMEAEYLNNYPNSGYLTEIIPLKSFPDYIDYLPQGSIVRKICVMGYLPDLDKSINSTYSITARRDSYWLKILFYRLFSGTNQRFVPYSLMRVCLCRPFAAAKGKDFCLKRQKSLHSTTEKALQSKASTCFFSC